MEAGLREPGRSVLDEIPSMGIFVESPGNGWCEAGGLALSFLLSPSAPTPLRAPLTQADGASAYLPLVPGFVRAVGEGAEPGAQLGGFEGTSCSWLCPGLQSTDSGSLTHAAPWVRGANLGARC